MAVNEHNEARGSARRRLLLRLFLASPGDVAYERQLVREVIEQVGSEQAFRGRVSLEVIAWDKPGVGVALEAGLTPQEAIARGLPKPQACDLVVVLLWSRIGTPLPAEYSKADGSGYLSGTQWEYENALAGFKASGQPSVWLYRRTEMPRVELDDPEHDDKLDQWRKVKTFFDGFTHADGSLAGGINLQHPLAVGQYEVTFAEYDQFAAATGRPRPGDRGWGRGDRPVINVSWEDATAYAAWLAEKTGKAYRLLSEAEWEYAARAGTETSWHWDEDPDQACDYVNGIGETFDAANTADEDTLKAAGWWGKHECDDGFVYTAPVGTYAPNAFGLHDMLGNVWEWVQDCYSESYAGAPDNGLGLGASESGRLWSPCGAGRLLGLPTGVPTLGLPLQGHRRLPHQRSGVPSRQILLIFNSFTLFLFGVRGRSPWSIFSRFARMGAESRLGGTPLPETHKEAP